MTAKEARAQLLHIAKMIDAGPIGTTEATRKGIAATLTEAAKMIRHQGRPRTKVAQF